MYKAEPLPKYLGDFVVQLLSSKFMSQKKTRFLKGLSELCKHLLPIQTGDNSEKNNIWVSEMKLI